MFLRRKRPEPVLHKAMRLSAFLFFAQALVSALLVRGVHAEVQDLMLSAGAQMMKLGEQLGEGPPRTLRLNGAQVRMRVARVPDATLDSVLDDFETRCRSRNGRFYEQLKGQGTKPAEKLDEQQLGVLDGVLRAETETTGAVACMDVGDEQGSPTSIMERAQRFVQTGDAASFGGLRYVRAQQDEHGVFAVMMWTDGPLNIRQMFPKEGDAPGVDFPNVPRPPGSRRVLSAWEEGHAPAINMYESPQVPAALDAHYRSELPKHGWEPLTPTPPADKPVRVFGMMAMRDGVTMTITHASVDDGRHGMTTLLPMDAQGATSVSAP